MPYGKFTEAQAEALEYLFCFVIHWEFLGLYMTSYYLMNIDIL